MKHLACLILLMLSVSMAWAQLEPVTYSWEGTIDNDFLNGEHSEVLNMLTPAPGSAKVYVAVTARYDRGTEPGQGGDSDNEHVMAGISGGGGLWYGFTITENSVRQSGQNSSRQGTWGNANLATAHPNMFLNHTQWEVEGEDNLYFNGAWAYANAKKNHTPTPNGPGEE